MNAMTLLMAIYITLIGAAMGSFAGAVAWRLSKGRDFVRERSECEHCHHTLAWYDLVPIISWLQLGGRCRYCRKAIGATTLWVEVVTAVAFGGSFAVWPYGFDALGTVLFVLWLIALTLLAILFLYDARHSLLPDVIMFPLIAVGVAIFVCKMLWLNVPAGTWVVEAILGLLPVSGLYGMLYVLSGGKWIGFGDVKFGVFMGLVLGWQGALVAVFLANYLAFFWIVPSLVRRRVGRESHMPFGPFLITATCIVFLWGEQVLGWLKGVLLI